MIYLFLGKYPMTPTFYPMTPTFAGIGEIPKNMKLKKHTRKANKATKPVVNKSPVKPKAKAKAKKVEEKPKHDPVFEEVQAPYHFGPEERADMSDQLRVRLDSIDTIKDQAKSAAADFKLRVTNEENAAKQLRQKLSNGGESRPVRARVEFHVEERMKSLFHPTTGEFIRKDPMQPADFQLPMFLPASDGNGEAPAPAGATDVPTGPSAPKADKKKGKGKTATTAEPGESNGKTNVGAALNAAAALTNAPKLTLTFDPTTADHVAITRAFKKAAKAAGWNEAQISTINDALRACDSEQKMIEVLAPHVAEAKQTETPAETPAAESPLPGAE